ncbi:Uncharacterised protein [Sphingobacterium daejeonense]|nr:Uncharacterised protein [Sphingobacterium daejeonense]
MGVILLASFNEIELYTLDQLKTKFKKNYGKLKFTLSLFLNHHFNP